MINPNMLCMRCMSQLAKENGFCSNCGFDNRAPTNELHQLECRSILAGAYLIGCVLGQGGFGITYTAWDLNLDFKVAIKEYYPLGYAARDSHTHVSVLTLGGDKREYYQKGLERFVNEAKTLARLTKDRGIVGVRGFLRENGTAYIVMDYVEGETLKNIAAKQGGKLPGQMVLGLFRPLCASLARVHAEGLLHRDISPDNIILQPDGVLTLIDFGAARQISAYGEHSNTINVKHGFAPEEQYRTHGEQGPWTDVYALCATMYRLMTGQTPPQALDRLGSGARIVPPRQLSADITPAQERAFLHGLSIDAQSRIQDMQGLMRGLYGSAVPTQRTVDEEEKKSPGIQPFIKNDPDPNSLAQKVNAWTKGRWKSIGVVAGSAIGLYLLILIGVGAFRGDARGQEPKGENLSAAVMAQTPVDAQTPAPTATQKPTPEPTAAPTQIPNPPELYLQLGFGEQYVAALDDFEDTYGVDSGDVQWSSGDTDIVTVSQNGIITAGYMQSDLSKGYNDDVAVTGVASNGVTFTYQVAVGNGNTYSLDKAEARRRLKDSYARTYVSDPYLPNCAGFTLLFQYESSEGKHVGEWIFWVHDISGEWIEFPGVIPEDGVAETYTVTFEKPINVYEIVMQPVQENQDFSYYTTYGVCNVIYAG
ncbi:MAG TPA: protein kinase [Clostridia bacterium]|nr:protein kinase [Clostridia bacterium]